MSLNTFKRKSVIQYGSKRSAKPPGGYWLPQGPFGPRSIVVQEVTRTLGTVGFSLNGPHRNVGYIGKESKFSKNGTPYRGDHALGSGGTNNRYVRSDPVFNVNEVIVLGSQWEYIKQSVLSNKGMLSKKYRWAYNGKYPNYWVQPVYTGNQTDTKSQGLYLHNLTTSSTRVTDINAYAKFLGYVKRGGPTLCQKTTTRFTYDDMAHNGPYTKELRQPETSSQHTLRIQRRCTDPLVYQRPFPYATNAVPCLSSIETFNSPPSWYTSENTSQQNDRENKCGLSGSVTTT
jgi:hypothetical protein